MLAEKVKEILQKIEQIGEPAPDRRLPQNSFYLDEDEVLCGRRAYGESRYPYMHDGLLVWAKQSGFINANDRGFCIFRPVEYGEEAPIGFFGGLPEKDGTYSPISLFEATARSGERADIVRYTVFTPECCYYIADTEKVAFAMRLHIDEKKHIFFSFCALNKTSEPQSYYMASFIEAVLLGSPFQSFWDRMGKYGRHFANGFTLRTYGNTLAIAARYDGNITSCQSNVAREAFVGINGRTIGNSESLRLGSFDRCYESVNTSHLPVASDMIHFSTEGYGSSEIDYCCTLCWDAAVGEKIAAEPIDIKAVESELYARTAAEKAEFDSMRITYKDEKAPMPSAGLMNNFVRSLQKQSSFCALGISYAGDCMGMRDVYQQIESSLIWQPEKNRAQIVKTIGFILTTGRPPRQFTMPGDPSAMPYFNMSKYIDQGVWIISTVYSYLAYTGDYSILDEDCGYYECDEATNSVTAKSSEHDSLLEHLLRIMDYLSGNIDTDYKTNCMRVLFGDWNDALDGLGKTSDEGKEFGSGVTVMATLQFRQNLSEMCEILEKVNRYTERIPGYRRLYAEMTDGILKYAIDTDPVTGSRRVVHGWGDKLSYKVGSFNDPDGVSRISLTSNAFWAISGMVGCDPSLKESIAADILATNSRYGLKTFDKPFPADCEEVGRIRYIVPGSYENSCSYAHAGMFGTMALFSLGKTREAWAQLSRLMVITHENATMSVFAMPNSYCENAKYGMDGESMGDWYTGSGTTCIKTMVKYGFGLRPTLSGLTLEIPDYIPFSEMSITLPIKGKKVTLTVTPGDEASLSLDGNRLSFTRNPISSACELTISDSELKDGSVITAVASEK